MGVQEIARKMAERKCAVTLSPCPIHEGHKQECYDRGHSDGWEDALEYVYQTLRAGEYDSFDDFYARYTEG
jgi:hypothetical protein